MRGQAVSTTCPRASETRLAFYARARLIVDARNRFALRSAPNGAALHARLFALDGSPEKTFDIGKTPFCQNSSWLIFPVALALRQSPSLPALRAVRISLRSSPRFSPIKSPDCGNPLAQCSVKSVADACQPHEFIPSGTMRAMIPVEIGAFRIAHIHSPFRSERA